MSRHLLVMPLITLISACAELPSPERFPDDFGKAVRTNMAAQIIAREGEVQTLAPAPGSRRSLAVERYQTDRVEQPIDVLTTEN